jgi:hypothetical protein
MLSGPYVVINQLIKSIWKVAHLIFKKIIHVKGKKMSILGKMTKIGTFGNKAQI